MSTDLIDLSCENKSTDEEASEESTRQFFSKLLQLSETGEMHDCTIRASSPTSTSYKDFRCHKLVLSLRSDMFKTMFSSNFKEAKMRPDEPIVLQNVEPEVFECVIRYIYGRRKDIKDTSFGAQVYKLAHELQIDSLIQELDIFFKGSKKASEVFAIFDLYLRLDGSQETLKSCKQLLERETAVALASEQWLNVSVEAVQEFLQMEHLNVEEVDLVKALIRWGKHQVEKDGDDPTDGKKLRSKIFPALKFIRFAALTHIAFADLCLEELGTVLNLEERYSILMALSTKRGNLIPREIFTPEAATPRKKPFAVFQLAFSARSNHNFSTGPFTATLGFVLDKNADFTGVKVNNTNHVYDAFTFQLLGAGATIGQGSSTDKINAEGEDFVKVNPSCSLTAGTNYALKLTFPCSNWTGNRYFTSYTLLPNQPVATSNGLTLSITSSSAYVYVEKMLFMLT